MPSLIAYKGVIPSRTSDNGIVAILRSNDQFDTGGGTSIVGILDNNPSASDNWSEYSTAWSEYRVLGMRLQFAPLYSVNTATITTGPIVHSVVHTSSVISPTDYAEALSIGDSKMSNITRPFVREWRMSDADEATWLPTSAPAATADAFAFAAFDLTTGTTYGQGLITYFVQFRTTRK